MSFDPEKLSGFLDGESSPEETRQIKLALKNDANLAAEFEQLVHADSLAKQEFEAMLSEPVSINLGAVVRGAPARANPSLKKQRPPIAPWWAAVAASWALVIGAAGGYIAALNTQAPAVAVPGWLTDVADYHRVYATQGRHLVEVPASEAGHIETWLTNTVGAEVKIPDLSDHDLVFRGGRLLVAAGKPVAQLMFTDSRGQVVALCLIATGKPEDRLQARQLDDFDMVTWGGDGANFVVVSNKGRADIEAIAQTAAGQGKQV